MFDDWIETWRTVWNKLRVFQVGEFALEVLLESPTKAYAKDRLTLRLKVLLRWAESSFKSRGSRQRSGWERMWGEGRVKPETVVDVWPKARFKRCIGGEHRTHFGESPHTSLWDARTNFKIPRQCEITSMMKFTLW
jgi:hypothetical protein